MLNQIQIDSCLMRDNLLPVYELFQKLYDKWRKKNAVMSVLKHYDIFNPIIKLGKPALRAIFLIMRGDPVWMFGTIDSIIEQEKMTGITIPKEMCGKLTPITEMYLEWADKNLPPTAWELFKSSEIAQETGDSHMRNVVIPFPGNYGGTYFSGSLKAAREYYKKAEKLRERAVEMLSLQKEVWEN